MSFQLVLKDKGIVTYTSDGRFHTCIQPRSIPLLFFAFSLFLLSDVAQINTSPTPQAILPLTLPTSSPTACRHVFTDAPLLTRADTDIFSTPASNNQHQRR